MQFLPCGVKCMYVITTQYIYIYIYIQIYHIEECNKPNCYHKLFMHMQVCVSVCDVEEVCIIICLVIVCC